MKSPDWAGLGWAGLPTTGGAIDITGLGWAGILLSLSLFLTFS